MDAEQKDRDEQLRGAREQLKYTEPEIDQILETIERYYLDHQQGMRDAADQEMKIEKRDVEIHNLK